MANLVTKRFNVVSLTDMHMPFHDTIATGCAFNFCHDIQPDIIAIHEVVDFYSLSRFNKDPSRATGSQLQQELNMAKDHFGLLRSLCPDSRIIHLDSNHLRRLQKYLWSEAKELCGLDCLDIGKLMDLSQFNIEFMTNYVVRDMVLLKHGDLVRKYASYTAKNELEKEGMSGVSGHTHRLGIHYSTKRGGSLMWIESGCLCDLNPTYMEGSKPDWQHGISMVSFKGDTDHYFATPIPIIDGEILMSF